MQEIRVGIRELKTRLSHYLRGVKAGGVVVITERGKPVGQILPVQPPLGERLSRLEEAGFLRWSGKRLRPKIPRVSLKSERLVSDVLLEDRE